MEITEITTLHECDQFHVCKNEVMKLARSEMGEPAVAMKRSALAQPVDMKQLVNSLIELHVFEFDKKWKSSKRMRMCNGN